MFDPTLATRLTKSLEIQSKAGSDFTSETVSSTVNSLLAFSRYLACQLGYTTEEEFNKLLKNYFEEGKKY